MTNKFVKIVFDTETTGFPNRLGFNRYFSPKETQHYDTSRLVQLAYIVISGDKSSKILSKHSSIIIPKNFRIENSHIHGITQEKAEKEGKCVYEVLSEFSQNLQNCSLLIAHNMNFDINILRAECYRTDIEELGKVAELAKLGDKLENIPKYCTMANGQQKYRLYKSPKLTELYEKLFGKKFPQKHEALDDAEHCLKCYVKMCEEN